MYDQRISVQSANGIRLKGEPGTRELASKAIVTEVATTLVNRVSHNSQNIHLIDPVREQRIRNNPRQPIVTNIAVS